MADSTVIQPADLWVVTSTHKSLSDIHNLYTTQQLAQEHADRENENRAEFLGLKPDMIVVMRLDDWVCEYGDQERDDGWLDGLVQAGH